MAETSIEGDLTCPPPPSLASASTSIDLSSPPNLGEVTDLIEEIDPDLESSLAPLGFAAGLPGDPVTPAFLERLLLLRGGEEGTGMLDPRGRSMTGEERGLRSNVPFIGVLASSSSSPAEEMSSSSSAGLPSSSAGLLYLEVVDVTLYREDEVTMLARSPA